MAAKASATAFALREDAEGADDPVPLWERAELCDRLTNLYLAEDIVRRPIALRDSYVALPDGPGLGIEVDEVAVARFRLR